MIIQEIQSLLERAVKKATKQELELELEQTRERSHGDYACNAAMQLAKKLEKNPREVALDIIGNIEENSFIEKVEIAGPGFMNITITDEAFKQGLKDISKKTEEKVYGKGEKKDEKIIVEYSQPNIAKPLGVHHLLSTIIGQSLSNILRFTGYDVTSSNYIGDWGTQFGKLIYAYKTWGDKKVVEKEPIAQLLKLYVKFHDEAEENEELEDLGRAEFKKLEQGDKENTDLWKWVVEISLDEIQKTYDKLGGISFDNFNGEASYREQAQEIIEEGKKKGIFKEGKEGALMVFFPDEKYPPYMIVKKDGATLYSTRDIACIRDRNKLVGKGKNIYVVDVAQKLYFQQLFETAKLLGYVTDSEPIHIEFGRMSFPDGSMSTRKGKVVLLDDVLDEAIKRASQKIEEHESELENKEKEELARMIGIGAVKYNVLSQNRLKNFTFVWDTMLSFDGNSAPYLQYAYTRTQSILKKAKDDTNEINITAEEEKELIKKLLQFPEILTQVTKEYKPNILSTYLFELSQAFSLFYNNLRILDAQEESKGTRLTLVKTTAYVLKTGLDLLGIDVPKKM